jgi:hypothetical protein
MPATESLGMKRMEALYQFSGLLLWIFVLSWTTLSVAFTIAFVWAAGNLIYKFALNDERTWGKAWVQSMLAWNYEFLYWSLSIESDFPGWFGWMPSNR